MITPTLRRTVSPFAARFLAGSVAALLAVQSAAHATNYYWDTDGVPAGAGSATPSGLWSSGGTTWSTSSAGTTATSAYTTLTADDLFFSAGTNATGAYTITLTGAQDAGSLTFEEGTATVSGAGGVLTLGGTGGKITVNSGAAAFIGANTDTILAGTLGLTKLGTGTLTLNGALANTVTGGLNISAGTMVLDYSNLGTPTNLIGSGNALTLGGGSTLTLTGKNSATNTTQTFAGTTLNVGINTLNIAKGASATSATLNLGALTINAGSITTINPNTVWATATPSTTEIVTITSFNGNALPGSGKVNVNAGLFYRQSASAGTARWVSVDNAGQLQALPASIAVLTAATAADPVNAYQISTADITLTNAAMSTYGLVLNPNANGRNLTLAASGTYTINGILGVQASNGTNVKPGTGTSNITIGPEKNLVINLDNSASVTISAPIANNGSTAGTGGAASAVTIASTAPVGTTPGTVILSGINTYTGGTFLNNGTVQFAAATAIGGSARDVTVASGATVTLGYAIDNAFLNRLVENSNAFNVNMTVASANNLNLSTATGANLPNAVLTASPTAGITYSGTITPGSNGYFFGNLITTNNFSNNTLFTNSSNLTGANAVVISGSSPVYLTGTTLSFTGGTTVLPGASLGFSTATVTSLGAGSIKMGAGATIMRTGGNLDNAFLTRLAVTANTFTIIGNNAGSANALDLTNFPNATLAFWDNAGTVTFAFTGAITPGSNGYRFGSTRVGNIINISAAGVLTGANNLTLLTGSLGQLKINNAQTYSGTTLLQASTLQIATNLAIQNSVIDTSGAGVINVTGATSPTFGGLSGSKNLTTLITTGYSTLVTGLTLNPGAGVSVTYSGLIPNGAAAGTSLTKTGLGTQILSNTHTYTGGTNVNAGTLQLSGTFNMPATGTLAVNANGSFSLADGIARATTAATTGVGLSLASGSTMVFDWNGASLDSLTTGGTATAAGNVFISINNTSLSGSGGTLITGAAGSTLNGATYILANNTNYTAALSSTPTTVNIGAQSAVAPLTDAYWLGGLVPGFLGSLSLSNGTTSNWALDAAGTSAGGVVPGGSAVNVIFGATGAAQQGNVTTGTAPSLALNLGSITFNDTAAVTIAGSNTITLNSTSGTAASTTSALATVTPGSAISVTSFANALNTISAPVALGASQTWNVASGKTLTVSGIVSGAFGLTKSDAGTATLSAVNTFTGPITIIGGTLEFSSSTATTSPYASTQININGASILKISSTGSNFPIYAGKNYTFDATGGGSILVGTGNYNAATAGFNITTLGGAQDTIGLITTSGAFGLNLGTGPGVTFDITLGSDAASDLTVTPIIANSAGVTKTGTGRLTLTGVNTYTGGTTINAGTLRVSGGGAVVNTSLVTLANVSGATFQIVGSETIGALTGGGGTGGAVSIDASQTLTLSSGTQTYAGTVSGAGTLTSSGATQTLNGALSHGAGVNVTTGVLTLGSAGNTYAGTTVVSSAAGLLVTANGALGATGAGNGTTVNGTGGGLVSGALGFSGGINYSSAEKVIGSGVGNTAVLGVFAVGQRGFIQSVSGNNSFAGDIELSGNGTSRIGTQEGAQLTLAGTITQGTGVTTANILFRVGNIAGDFVTLSNAANTFGGDSTVFTAATAGNYAGVRLGITNGLPTNLTITSFSGTGAGAAFDLAGFHQSLNGLITGSGAGSLSIINTNTLTPSTLTLNPTANKSSTNTLIVGGGSLGVINVVKDGAFSQTLPGTNTYTGTTKVNAGTLSINSIKDIGGGSSALGAPATVAAGLITIGNAATTGTLLYSGAVQSTDRTIQIGTNSTTPANTDTGGATIQADGASNAALTFSTANFNTQTNATAGVGANRTLTLQGVSTGANTISGIIQDNLVSGAGTGTATVALTKGGVGTWVLAGANTYSGATTVSAGILSVGNSLAMQNSALDTLNSITGDATNGLQTTLATLAMGGLTGNKNLADVFTSTAGGYSGVTALTLNPGTGATPSYAAAIADGATGMTLTKSGAGTQTLSGANGYTGATTVSAGRLEVQGSLSGTTSVTVNSGCGLFLNSGTNANNIVNTAATFTTGGSNTGQATLTSGNATPGVSNAFAQMTLAVNTTLDFSNGKTTLLFSSLETATKTALADGSGITLTIANWSGISYGGSIGDTGATDNTSGTAQSHLLFTNDPGFVIGTVIPGISFTGFGPGAIEVNYGGGGFEIVPVPEPATVALIGAVALCALTGRRGYRRPCRKPGFPRL